MGFEACSLGDGIGFMPVEDIGIGLNPKVFVLNPRYLALNPKVFAVNPKILAVYPRVDTRR
jgi:hypothetical protein